MVDHSHTVAARHPHSIWRGCALCIRGVCCDDCNVALGRFHDNPAAMRRAADIVERFEAAR